MQAFDVLKVLAQGGNAHFREHRDSIFRSLALAHGDLPVREIDVFNSQAEALEQPESTTAHESGHKQEKTVQFAQYAFNLIHRKDLGKLGRPVKRYRSGMRQSRPAYRDLQSP
jgi:hypothetical protein